eukprot:gnl/TRDRNA2_/TRDRNA2_67679_c0_seq1.p2 gnl/TRDRNA2_/TRDRNA2_67679_c0~~gnl/TRDRNA2_/TRDRNA2_67679_c0_seq1.p2  ORF type:complete len:120 (+),score=21.61 gnl/TRDRNA2_/TRDRNA2_67679_c0_seq1:396-755(+)
MRGQADKSLFRALSRKAERQVISFNTKELASTAWAFSTVHKPDQPLLTAFAGTALRRLAGFATAAELADVAWALANAGWSDELLFRAFAKAAGQCTSSLNAQSVRLTLWALSHSSRMNR